MVDIELSNSRQPYHAGRLCGGIYAKYASVNANAHVHAYAYAKSKHAIPCPICKFPKKQKEKKKISLPGQLPAMPKEAPRETTFRLEQESEKKRVSTLYSGVESNKNYKGASSRNPFSTSSANTG
jgi:hypothetical protein